MEAGQSSISAYRKGRYCAPYGVKNLQGKSVGSGSVPAQSLAASWKAMLTCCLSNPHSVGWNVLKIDNSPRIKQRYDRTLIGEAWPSPPQLTPLMVQAMPLSMVRRYGTWGLSSVFHSPNNPFGAGWVQIYHSLVKYEWVPKSNRIVFQKLYSYLFFKQQPYHLQNTLHYTYYICPIWDSIFWNVFRARLFWWLIAPFLVLFLHLFCVVQSRSFHVFLHSRKQKMSHGARSSV